ncbi:MAG: hypothetical protein RBJ76_03100 [Stenomitos frigidus ULC029]
MPHNTSLFLLYSLLPTPSCWQNAPARICGETELLSQRCAIAPTVALKEETLQ